VTVEDPAAAPINSDAPPGSGRVGRNLPAAIAVGVTMGAVAAGSLALSRVAFVALVSVMIVVGVWELCTALAVRDVHPPFVPLAIGSVAMLVAAQQGGTEALVVSLALTLLGVLGWRLAEGPIGFAADVTAGVFTAAYVPFLAGFAVLLDAPSDGPRRVASYAIVVVCNDVGGYAAGVLFGKHQMAPRISPKKSWEGMAGSLTACAIGGAVCMTVLLHGRWWQGVLLGVVLAVAATIGDLGESVLKRDLGVKDMGALLPGHGGIMDRLDSLLVAAPAAWLVLASFHLR
jgi:phosphatidate cytidylyltransferase